MKNVTLDLNQLDAVNKLGNGKILCGDVGSGKSRTALAYFILREVEGSFQLNGEGEFAWAKKPKNLYIITTARKRNLGEWVQECALYGISSDQEDREDGISVQIDSWNNIGKYVGVKDAFFIFDEQRLVGKGSWTKSFRKIAKDNHWILLSATPGDNWIDYVPVFLANGFYKNRTEFNDEHVIFQPHTTFPKVKGYRGEGKLIRLRASLLVDIPIERHTTRHNITLKADYDRDLFDTVVKKRWNPYDDQPIENVAQLFYLMRKVVNNHSDRLWHIERLLETHPRLIIFYTFDYELENLRLLKVVEGVEVAEYNGHRHDDLPTSPKWVYLVQYTSGSEGWNCTSTNALVFYSLNYSYRMTEQAKGRIDRRNTPYTDLYYYTIRSSSPIDMAILRALRAKKNFNEKNCGILESIGVWEDQRCISSG